MKKTIQTIFCLIIITLIFNFSIVYADPGSSKGFANFDDEEAEKQAQELEKEQQEEEKKREGKSSNNYLESLSIDGYELQPAFDKEIQEYFVNGVTEGQKVKINAIPNENTATVSGTGEIEVKNNEARIDVTAENGTVRTYFIEFNMQETKNEEETTQVSSEEVEDDTTEENNEKEESKEIHSNELKTESKEENNTVAIVGVVLAIFVIIVIIIISINKKQKKGRHF